MRSQQHNGVQKSMAVNLKSIHLIINSQSQHLKNNRNVSQHVKSSYLNNASSSHKHHHTHHSVYSNNIAPTHSRNPRTNNLISQKRQITSSLNMTEFERKSRSLPELMRNTAQSVQTVKLVGQALPHQSSQQQQQRFTRQKYNKNLLAVSEQQSIQIQAKTMSYSQNLSKPGRRQGNLIEKLQAAYHTRPSFKQVHKRSDSEHTHHQHAPVQMPQNSNNGIQVYQNPKLNISQNHFHALQEASHFDDNNPDLDLDVVPQVKRQSRNIQFSAQQKISSQQTLRHSVSMDQLQKSKQQPSDDFGNVQQNYQDIQPIQSFKDTNKQLGQRMLLRQSQIPKTQFNPPMPTPYFAVMNDQFGAGKDAQNSLEMSASPASGQGSSFGGSDNFV